MRKAWVLIHIFCAIQIALPLSYYVLRADRHDERFAWRMFSPERMTRCTPVFLLGEARDRVRAGAVFHEAWLTLAARGRLDVVSAMAGALCARNPGQPVRVELTCRTVDGKDERHGGGWDLCALGKP